MQINDRARCFVESGRRDNVPHLWHWFPVRLIRRFVADRLNGGILAALLVYALLFQSIATGLANAHMSALQATPVRCEASAPAHHGHENSDRIQGCCTALCLAACRADLASISPDHEDAPGFEWSKTATLRRVRLGPVSIQHRGLRREARAPPPISA